jgi:hypothetical protein
MAAIFLCARCILIDHPHIDFSFIKRSEAKQLPYPYAGRAEYFVVRGLRAVLHRVDSLDTACRIQRDGLRGNLGFGEAIKFGAAMTMSPLHQSRERERLPQ